MSEAMQKFTQLTSTLAPLPNRDVDTDQIIPARYLKITHREGLAEGLFSNWIDDPDFVLNKPSYNGAKILLAGNNFGCGSSREHAPWALLDYGFQAIISTRFADIFCNNALKNGLLVVTVEEDVWQKLMETVLEDSSARVTIDLEAGVLRGGGICTGDSGREDGVEFSIDPLARQCMLEGTDQFGYLLSKLPAIEAWEAGRAEPVNTLP